MTHTQKTLFDESGLLLPENTTDAETIDLSGFQVTRSELFSHNLEPSITLWPTRIKFNMACLRKFPGVKYIQLLINPEQKRIIIRPCDQNDPDSLRWATGGGETELKNRDMICRIFASRIYDLMDWNKDYRYKILGKPAICEDQFYFLFKLTDFELFLNTGNKKNRGYLPEYWKDYFGIPVEKHSESFKIDPADGYVTTTKA